jgi:periplasmic copper chaperone A
MRTRLTNIARMGTYFAIVAALAVSTSGCRETPVEPIEIEEAYLFPSVLGNMAGFLSIRNNGSQEDTLMSVGAEGIDSITIHSTERDGGLARMVYQPTLPIPRKSVITMRSGEIHLMITGFEREYRVGDSCRLVATFAKAGAIPVTAVVKDFGAE